MTKNFFSLFAYLIITLLDASGQVIATTVIITFWLFSTVLVVLYACTHLGLVSINLSLIAFLYRYSRAIIVKFTLQRSICLMRRLLMFVMRTGLVVRLKIFLIYWKVIALIWNLWVGCNEMVIINSNFVVLELLSATWLSYLIAFGRLD